MPVKSGTINNIYLAFLKLQRKLDSNHIAGTATDATRELAELKQHIETAKLEDAAIVAEPVVEPVPVVKPPFFPGAITPANTVVDNVLVKE